MKKVILSLLMLVVLFATYASAKRSSTVDCTVSCLSKIATQERGARAREIRKCIKEVCIAPKVPSLDKKLNALNAKIERLAQKLLDKDVQNEEAVLTEEIAALTDSETFADASASVKNGDTLQATTGLNIRSGPCTTNSIVGGLKAGQTTRFTGKTATGCGYTWYSVSNGWVASNFVKVSGGGGGGGGGGGAACRTRNYPLFKQCDGKWGGNALGSSSVCKIGCLMSSVSMALNGLGKSINGQSPNPGTLNSFLKSNGGYQGNLFIWGSVARFGLRYQGQPTNKAEIKKHVCANNVVILNVKGGGHWVLATGVSADGNTFYVNDPGASKSTYSAGEVVRAGIFTL